MSKEANAKPQATEMGIEESQSAKSHQSEQAESRSARSRPRGISNPNDVAALVMTQMNIVNNKKDELTIAIKGLSDITQQLVHAYAENTKTIIELSRRVKMIESKDAENKIN